MTSRRKWSNEEDSVLIAQVKAHPQNLNACFLAASQLLGRGSKSCAARWYKYLSKKPENACFVTISGRHKAMNRKNGAGVSSSVSVFKRILKFLRLS